MPIDCVPMQQVLCIPPAYEKVIGYRSLDVRPPVSPEDVRRAGAKITITESDLPVVAPVAGMGRRQFGEITVFYARKCIDTACGFSFVVVDRARLAQVRKCGAVTYNVTITGDDAAGLARALGAIRVRIDGAPARAWPTLASLPDRAVSPTPDAARC